MMGERTMRTITFAAPSPEAYRRIRSTFEAEIEKSKQTIERAAGVLDELDREGLYFAVQNLDAAFLEQVMEALMDGEAKRIEGLREGIAGCDAALREEDQPFREFDPGDGSIG